MGLHHARGPRGGATGRPRRPALPGPLLRRLPGVARGGLTDLCLFAENLTETKLAARTGFESVFGDGRVSPTLFQLLPQDSTRKDSTPTHTKKFLSNERMLGSPVQIDGAIGERAGSRSTGVESVFLAKSRCCPIFRSFPLAALCRGRRSRLHQTSRAGEDRGG